jgi:hypothetical protein
VRQPDKHDPYDWRPPHRTLDDTIKFRAEIVRGQAPLDAAEVSTI